MKTTRYTVNRLASESGLDRRTLAKLLAGTPTPDDRFTLADFADALLARRAIAAARLEKLQGEASIAKQEAAEMDEQLIDIAEFRRDAAPRILDAVRIIEASQGLSDAEKFDLRTALAEAIGGKAS